MIRPENLDFGSGSFVGTVSADPEFFEQPVRDQALILGWADGCPVAKDLTDPENLNPGRGPEAMVSRYGEVNFLFTYAAQLVEEANPKLHKQLTASVPRLSNEPVGKYEPVSVPDSHLERIAPMGQLAGFAVPRLFSAILDSAKSGDIQQRQSAFFAMTEVVEHAAASAETPAEFMAQILEDLIEGPVDRDTLLKISFGKGWLEEHNADVMLQEYQAALATKAPRVWSYYSALDEPTKTNLNLM